MISSAVSAVASLLSPEDEDRSNAASNTDVSQTIQTQIDGDATCSDLYDLVLEMRWYWALKHTEKRPQDAAWHDADTQETPLHLACQNRPPVRLIKALLKAYPFAATSKAYKTRLLPLHLACRYNASIEVLRELLSEHPATAASEGKYGTTPLHSLLEGRDTIASTETENYRTIFWQKVELLLRSIALTRGDEMYLLHAAVSIGSLLCPDSVLDFCLDQHAHLVRHRDSTGRLPLHLVVGPAAYSEMSRRRYKPRELHALHRLLERFPEAARQQDPNEQFGRMPLHTALLNGHEWYGGVKELFEAAPEVALVLDPVTMLYPYQASQDCDTVYKLLKSFPCVLRLHGKGPLDADNSIASKKAMRRRSVSDLSIDGPVNDILLPLTNNEKEVESHWTNHCFMGAFVVGAVASIVYRFFAFVDDDHGSLRVIQDNNQ
jgi:ankyrin repeat protein